MSDRSDSPHLYGTAPEAESKQGKAGHTLAPDQQAPTEHSYAHPVALADGKVVTVEETSGVAFAESDRPVGRAVPQADDRPEKGSAPVAIPAAHPTPNPGPGPGPVADESSSTTRQVVIGAALGVGVGLLANLLRKAAVQAPTALAGRWDKALAAEHRAALAIFDLIEQTDENDVARRTLLLTQLKHAIGKHAFQEENSIYAMMRDLQMTEAADHLNHEHGYVKQYFFDLGEMPRDDPAWLPKLRAFRSMIETHMREEEEDLFPRMREKLTGEQNRHLTRLMHREGLKLA
ncbi:hemerythrin domain-containing protein [Sphingomonas abaci]|uniref:Hemerythrin superfamily protein n=1 Tax=Sphingomonas abaci TaxID=237611 RepID=A0A7W7EWW4_9SPHN|nr:hemerythrin domain-containing protein [Sphingomonas abaci]MBB4616501.1 hemerythrin superfamily protein [Sphingomonas abaci]